MTILGAGALFSWLIADGVFLLRFLGGGTESTWVECIISLLFVTFWCIYVLKFRKYAGWMTLSLVFAAAVNATLLLRLAESFVTVLPGILHGITLVLTLFFLTPFAGLSVLFDENWFVAAVVLSVPWLLASALFLLRARKEKGEPDHE